MSGYGTLFQVAKCPAISLFSQVKCVKLFLNSKNQDYLHELGVSDAWMGLLVASYGVAGMYEKTSCLNQN